MKNLILVLVFLFAAACSDPMDDFTSGGIDEISLPVESKHQQSSEVNVSSDSQSLASEEDRDDTEPRKEEAEASDPGADLDSSKILERDSADKDNEK